MKQTPKYVKEVQGLLANLDTEDNQDKQPLDTDIPDQVIDMYIEDFAEEERITLIRKKPSSMPVIGQEEGDVSDLDTAPLAPKSQPEPVTNATIVALFLGMLVPLLCLAVQLYFIVNPYTVTLTILTKSQQMTLNGTLQLGRVISPLTLSQSQTVSTTGKGHQDARAATGTIEIYNGLNTAQTVNAGTILTGQDGMQVVTDQTITVPAANLPQIGAAPVTAHALNAGSAGNIQAYDISVSLSGSLTAKNPAPFSGGQDERNFQTVAPSDIANTAAPLKATLDQSMQNTLTGQLKSGEALTSSHCTPTTTTDHRAGDEAIQVKVTVSETCTGVAYNQDTLQAKVTQLLNIQAAKKLEPGYSLLGDPQITVTSATTSKQVTLSFHSISTWVYALKTEDQQQIKKLIAGKDTDRALQLLYSLPGIKRVTLTSSGFADTSQIPKDISHIHLMIFYGL